MECRWSSGRFQLRLIFRLLGLAVPAVAQAAIGAEGTSRGGPAAGGLVRERPWVGVVFFYWYTWDYNQQLGGWLGGVHNTPLYGYYDSRTYRDNYRSLELASEWGVTHHWMDYWAPTWKDDQGQMREKTVVRAAEDLRKAGYNIWMSYYQDGENFEMKDFVKNVSEKRDVYQWLRDFARSPVWPRVQGKPHQLVYSRNGAPRLTNDHVGFRQFLKTRYETIGRLNEDWGTKFQSFDVVEMDLSTRGPQRAWSAKYQHEIWRGAWSELDKQVQKEFDLPGMVASFDVGYGPYANLGYAEFIRTFGGPHSYAGIFGPPHDQDAERFIQANVGKAYGAVFLDHYKNYYHDWDIRVPGTAILPDPYHFDRFWVGDLMRFAEAILHLSWNEWWEGSNLEPCMEWGKTYCQKQLFYSTLMQFCYESIRDWSKGARVALLLNDYQNLAGSIYPQEMRETLQALRRLNCDFDLIADDFVTPEKLKDFRVVIAPSAGTGFGYNAEGKRIAAILLDWVAGGKERRLIVSADEVIRQALGLKPDQERAARTGRAGEDLNLLVDVGLRGDDRYLIAGCSGRESFGKVIPGQFTLGQERTFRWAPAIGRVTTLSVPLSPYRDHILRVAGHALWPSTAEVRLDGVEIGRLAIRPGDSEYEVRIPASAVGARGAAMIDLIYDPLNVPGEKDAKAYPGEARACNLALDWFQISTSNVAAHCTTQQYKAPSGRVRFGSELFGRLKGRTVEVPLRVHSPSLGKARMLSLYEDGAPRDVIVDRGQGGVLYVNGLFSDVKDDEYWRWVLSNWTHTPPAELVRGQSTAGARLFAGQTDFLLAYNYNIAAPDRIACRLPARSYPLSEAVALTKDGAMYEPIKTRRNGQWVEWDDTLSYYGVYQLAYAPVRVETTPISVSVGQTTQVPAKVTNLTDQLIDVKVAFRSVIPTLTGQAVEVSLWPRQAKVIQMPLTVGVGADWGRKTAVVEIRFDGDQKAFLWREVVVLRPPSLSLVRHVASAGETSIEVANARCPFGDAAPALDASATIAGRSVKLGPVPPGGRVTKALNVAMPASTPSSASTGDALEAAALQPHKVALTCMDDRNRLQVQEDLWVARPAAAARKYPGAVAAVSVFNHYGRDLNGEVVELILPQSLAKGGPCHLRDAKGAAVPAQVVEGSRLLFLAWVPAHGATSYTLVRGRAAEEKTDLAAVDPAIKGLGLAVANTHYRVELHRSEGGTAARLISNRTGRDYGLASFDANYGQFSRYDPNSPVVNTITYVRDTRTLLSHRPCVFKQTESGPIRVAVVAEVADGNIKCRTTYEFLANMPYFRVKRHLEFIGKQWPEEIVVVDAKFRRNGLTKSFPNFVGEVNDKPQPHFGWRYGNWVPDYLTLMTPPAFDESLSLVMLRKDGLDQIRQGFWPAERPKPGPCEQARIEMIDRQAGVCDVEFVVYLHRGHQVAAGALFDELRDPPLATVTMEPLWREP
jgi:hypothetical protein